MWKDVVWNGWRIRGVALIHVSDYWTVVSCCLQEEENSSEAS